MLLRSLVFLTFLFSSSLFAQEDELFEITRNKDEHKIIYYLNLDKNGNLDLDEPIGAYWRRRDESGSRSKSLSALEKKYAYGLKYLETTRDLARFRFVSYDKRDFVLKKVPNSGFAVYTEVNGNQLRIVDIHLHLDGGTFWFPRISSIQLNGLNRMGEEQNEIIQDP